VGAADRQLIAHSDNARRDAAKKVNEFLVNNRMTRMFPYSPDLAPCDFFLFSHIKNQLMGQSCDDANQLLMAIKKICESIEKAVLEKMFCERRERLTKCLVGAMGWERTLKNLLSKS
jgi:hypothetical protein